MMSEITETVAHWLALQARAEIEAENSFYPFGVVLKGGKRQYLIFQSDRVLEPQECVDRLVAIIDEEARQQTIEGAGICFSSRAATELNSPDTWREITAITYGPDELPEIWTQRIVADGPGASAAFGDLNRLGTPAELGDGFPIIPTWTH